MNYRDVGHWNIAELNEGFIFCIQRLDELLFDYTIDSYKPRALNPPSLCYELMNVIDEVENGSIDRSNLKYIIEELREAISRDKVSKELVNSNVEHFLGYSEETSLSKFKLRISVLERSFDRYRYIAVIQKKLIEAVHVNAKDDINSILMNYITTLINWGVSKNYIYSRMNKFFFNKDRKIESVEELDAFLTILKPKRHGYDVFFHVSKNISLLSDSFGFFGIEMIDELEDELKVFFEKNNFLPKQNDVLLRIKSIRHADPYVARDVAEKRLETIRNTSQLFFHHSRMRWKKSAWVMQQCCDKEIVMAKNPINPMVKSYNYKSNEVAKNTNKIFRNIALNKESFNKFNRILELHSNCLQNLTPENQIVNLWTILETVVPSSRRKSKVQSICNSIIPILMIRYHRKLILNLCNDLNRWNKEKITNIITELSLEDNNFIHSFAIFISSPEYEEKRKELYAELGDYPLLRNRIHKLSSTLGSCTKLLKHLENHKKNIEWQIRRVYRTRNMVVHLGRSPKYINILIENTHDYIDQVISEITDMTISNYRIYDIEQAFEFGNILLYEYWGHLNKHIPFDCPIRWKGDLFPIPFNPTIYLNFYRFAAAVPINSAIDVVGFPGQRISINCNGISIR